MSLEIRPITPADRAWVARFMVEHWGAEIVVAHGVIYRPDELPGFVAEEDGRLVGLATYHVEGDACEVVTIDSVSPGQGVGTALLEAVADTARAAGCRRLWLITTNDNLSALRFYQRRGLRLVAVRPDAMEAARALKPQIPLIGAYGIPIRDEIELAMSFISADRSPQTIRRDR